MKWILSSLFVLCVAMTAQAELKSNQVALLAMTGSPVGQRIANYYAKARGIPASQICLLAGRPGERVSRQVYDEQMRPAIARWLRENDLDEQIECFVTCWDVPLKIAKRPATDPKAVGRKDYLTQTRKTRVKQFISALQFLEAQGNPEKMPLELPGNPEEKLGTLTSRFSQSLKVAKDRVALLKGDAKKTASSNVEKAYTILSGTFSVMAIISRKENDQKFPAEVSQRIAMLKGLNTGLNQGLKSLALLPDTVARDSQLLPMLQQAHGLIGVIRWIDVQLTLLKKNETHAAFDSELSLLHWPCYPKFSWVNNNRHYRFDNSRAPYKTLMVSRLAAPHIDRIKQLVDMGIEIEAKGLVGKVYLDDRSPKKSGAKSAYALYGRSLHDLADRLKKHTDLTVVLDTKGRLFQPGECPEAALYCGWYALGNYIDAFDWRPGAIGYHMASIEATRLRVPGNKVWCNAALEDGITATLGPVEEPSLNAFPLPDDFFSLLVTGRFTLVETYYRTKPFNSWQMTLVGDPLYNPFKNNPLLSEDDLPNAMRKKGTTSPVL